MSKHKQLVEDLAEVLEQASALLAKLGDQQFNATVEGASSVGAHHRHVLEYAKLLVDGVEHGYVDFDARDRNALVESNREAAIAANQKLCQRIRTMDAALLDAPLVVAHCTSFAANCEVQSTPARELLFVLSHSIHHYALIRHLLDAQSVEVPPTFGYMPSTLRAMAEAQPAAE